MSNYNGCCCSRRYCSCCCIGIPGADGRSAYQVAVDNGFIGTEQEWLDSLKGGSEPFLSSYIEAVGSSQDIDNQRNFIFDTDPDSLDIAGNNIELDASGTVFTIRNAGLYRVEWSMNLSSASNPVLVGLLEAGFPSSALSNNSLVGNYSSGALINVGEDELPYTVTLHNFGAPISIASPETVGDTAVSMRISRFANGPSS